MKKLRTNAALLLRLLGRGILLRSGLFILVLSSCSQSSDKVRELNTAEKLWVAADSYYRTNELRAGYRFTLSARDDLVRRSKSAPEELNYEYCLARVNGRLFLIARALGYTNEAADFLNESEWYFNAERKKSSMPLTNFSPVMVEYLMSSWEKNTNASARKAQP